MKKKLKEPVAFIAPGIRSMFSVGSYNGYVAVPPTHPLYKVHYLDGNDLLENIDVHGGITWADFAAIEHETKDGDVKKEITNMVKKGEAVSGKMGDVKDDWWVFGFDTAHYGDNPIMWNKKTVTEETLRFLKQINSVLTKINKK